MSEFTSERLAELKAVAEAAFPVEDWAIWKDLKEGGFIHVGNARGVIPEGEIATPEDAEPNPVAKAYTPELGRHIATFDPPTVTALIAALEAKTAEVERRKRQARRAEAKLTQYERSVPALTQERDAARRERDEARAYADDHVLDAEATYVRMAEKLEQVKRECDAAQLVMDTHSCGENVEAAYRRTIEAERERDEARAEVERWQALWNREDGYRIDSDRRADRAEAAIERVRAPFFANHLYFIIMSNPSLNNEAGEALYDRIITLIRDENSGT